MAKGDSVTSENDARQDGKLKRKEYEKELRKLQAELCQLQEWVKHKGLRVIIVFEGRDAAGKGGTITRHHRARQPARVPRRRAARAVRPREVADVHAALHAALPGGGRDRDLRPQLVQPRRRRVRDGLLHQGAARALPRTLPASSRSTSSTAASSSSRSGWRSSDKEQKRRFEARIDDPLRQWKLSPMDLPSRSRWFEYSRARDMMLEATDTKHAPWYILRSDDKKRARLNCIAHLLKPDPLQEGAAREGQAAQALDEGRLRRPGVAEGPEVRARTVLTISHSDPIGAATPRCPLNEEHGLHTRHGRDAMHGPRVADRRGECSCGE